MSTSSLNAGPPAANGRGDECEASVATATVPASCRRPVWPVVMALTALALALRLWFLGALPLVITNDGVGYLNSAKRLATSADFGAIPAVRTPGYPVFLAGVYHVFGVSATGVLVAHVLLGCAMTALLTYAAARITGRWWAIIPGVLAAADPWLLAIEHYALSEPLALALVAAAATLALATTRLKPLMGVILGAALAGAALTRPACQALIPFLVLAWALRCGAGNWKRIGVHLALAVLGVGLTLGPWVLYNRQRDVSGVASGFGVMQWRSLLHFGLLDLEFPADERLRAAIGEFEGKQPSWEATRAFAYEHLKRDNEYGVSLSAWNRASIGAKPGEFLRYCGYACCWLLNYTPADGPNPGKASWINWALGRLAEDGDNKQYVGDPQRLGLNSFAMSGTGGAARAYVAWWERNLIGGLPQIPLFALTVLAIPLALLRRDWCTALVFTGALAFVAAHVAILFPVSRYLMPVWPLWFLAAAVAPWQACCVAQNAWRRLRRDRAPAVACPTAESAGDSTAPPGAE